MSAKTFTLYYFPGSYYSQKALLALFEKDVDFNKRTVDVQNGYHLDAWYMRLNPNGNVPTLQHGDKILIESNDILKYLDQEIPTGPTLFPDTASPVGKAVEKWYNKLDTIKIEQISFGVLRNQDVFLTNVNVHSAFKKIVTLEAIRRRFDQAREKIRQNAKRYPDLRDTYLAKLKSREGLYSGSFCTVEITKKILDDLEALFDEIEDQLKKTKEAQGSSNIWLLGPELTAPDIIMVIFLDRLNFIGILERYCVKSKRPLVHDYFTRLPNRKSVQRLRSLVPRESGRVLLCTKIKQTMPCLLGVTSVLFAAGLGIYFWKQRTS